MANEKRLIDAKEGKKRFCAIAQPAEYKGVIHLVVPISEIDKLPTVDAVEVVLFNALKSLVNGEWVDCKLIQEALGIDFATGLKLFDFSRTAEWNPAPLNGQKITTKFRLKNAVVHGWWIPVPSSDMMTGKAYKCSECGKMRYGSYMPNYCQCCGAKMDYDGFCSNGERRTDV